MSMNVARGITIDATGHVVLIPTDSRWFRPNRGDSDKQAGSDKAALAFFLQWWFASPMTVARIGRPRSPDRFAQSETRPSPTAGFSRFYWASAGRIRGSRSESPAFASARRIASNRKSARVSHEHS